ncbi:ATP-binding protein, partial [Acinetobacter baumannii]
VSASLTDSLEQLIRRLQHQTRSAIEFQIEGQVFPLPDNVAGELVRIAQESLNNAVRHACCTSIRVALRFDNTSHERLVRLAVKDDGIGFDSSEA